MIYKELKIEKHQDQNMEQKDLNKIFTQTFLKKGKSVKIEKILFNSYLNLKKKKQYKNPTKFLINTINKILPKVYKTNLKKKNSNIIFLKKNKQLKITLKWINEKIINEDDFIKNILNYKNILKKKQENYKNCYLNR